MKKWRQSRVVKTGGGFGASLNFRRRRKQEKWGENKDKIWCQDENEEKEKVQMKENKKGEIALFLIERAGKPLCCRIDGKKSSFGLEIATICPTQNIPW